MVTTPRVHDLIHLNEFTVGVLSQKAALQGHTWVKDSLQRAPVAVVRRQRPLEPGNVAIGVRGSIRSHRWAAEIPAEAVSAPSVLTPESLRSVSASSNRRSMPAFSVLAEVCAIDSSLNWGPGGSVGFELASGLDSVTPISDLDLVARIPGGSALSEFESCLIHFYGCLAPIAEKTGTRIDGLVETKAGALSLEEIAGHSHALGSASVVLRTSAGPQLISDPWSLQ